VAEEPREEDRKNIEILATQIINKILHDPVTGLKEESQSNGAMPYVAAIRKLFGSDRGSVMPW